MSANDYRCGDCDASSVRLWRPYQIFGAPIPLRCCACAARHEGKPDPGANGPTGTDQIGWSVPAVPTSDGLGFWGYSSVPPEGVAWWYALPVRAAP